jgi:hypothetical protein
MMEDAELISQRGREAITRSYQRTREASGYAAFFAGADNDDNPFDSCDQAGFHADWERGWFATLSRRRR